MRARYLVRFDDICPTMDWKAWARIDAALQAHGIKPLLAVTPDNRDPHLVVDPPRTDFWAYIRSRQQLGWSIAMHGCHHVYESRDAGLLALNPFSEFAGLAFEDQKEKIAQAQRTFAKHDVRVDAWVAPGHSFDATTVRLLLEAGIQVVSDGFYFRPIQRLGAVWIPQQLWRFRRMPVGLWTVCLHPNGLSEQGLARLEGDFARYVNDIVDLPTVLARYTAAPLGVADRWFSRAWLAILRLRKRLRA